MSVKNIEKFSSATLDKEQVPFTQLPNIILQTNMNPFAFQLWAYLCSQAPEWIVRKSQLCDHFKCSLNKINRAFTVLYAMKLASLHQDKDADNRFVTARIMIHLGIKVVANFEEQSSVDKSKIVSKINSRPGTHFSGVPGSRSTGKRCPINKDIKNKEKEKTRRERHPNAKNAFLSLIMNLPKI